MLKRFHFLMLIASFIMVHPFYSYGMEKEDRPKKALIWGISGQDGRYLTQLLLSKNYEVHGVTRQNILLSDLLNLDEQFLDKLYVYQADITDQVQVKELIDKVQPDEIYNLAAQSSVAQSFKDPYLTFGVNFIGTLNILEALRLSKTEKKPKLFQASSIEIFGSALGKLSCENSNLMDPYSAYGESKLFAYRMAKFYRKNYNLFVCSGILCNHESPLRGENFITKIVAKSVAQIYMNKRESFDIGNLNAQRDWGHAQDYVEGMWLMLQQEVAEDFIFATGEIHSVKELVETAFKLLDIDIEWSGEGVNEIGSDKKSGKLQVSVNPEVF